MLSLKQIAPTSHSHFFLFTHRGQRSGSALLREEGGTGVQTRRSSAPTAFFGRPQPADIAIVYGTCTLRAHRMRLIFPHKLERIEFRDDNGHSGASALYPSFRWPAEGRFIHIVAAVPLYPTSQTEGDWYVGSILRDLASLSMRQTQRGGCSYFLPYIFFFEDVGRIPE